MAAIKSSTFHAPLARVAGILAQQNLLTSTAGGALAFVAFLSLKHFELPDYIRAGVAIFGAVAVQLGVSFILQKRNSSLIAPVDQAVAKLSQLGTENFNQGLGIEQSILDSYKTLQTMKSSSAQALLDAKLTNVRLHHLDTVLNTLPFGVIVFDADAKISLANRALAPMLGQPSSELLGKSLNEWCDIPDLQQHLSQGLRKEQHTKSITVCHPLRPNRWIEVELRDPIESDSDIYVACFYDSTDAVQAQKARSDFVTHLSHELKTPLHTMNLFTEILRGPDGESSEARLDAANVIGDEIERIDSLIRNLLDTTLIEAGTLNLERTRVRLPELLNDCLKRIQPNMLERQITLVSNIPNSMQAVFIDKTMFSVALNNILSNAVKYNRDQGTLTVDMKESDADINITISDSGLGIPEKDLPFIFDKFYRASNAGKDGHGIGLSLAREIVQKHHGHLTVKSTEGEGTTLSLTLNKSSALTNEAA